MTTASDTETDTNAAGTNREQAHRFGWSLANEVIGLGTSAVLFLSLTEFFEPATYGRLAALLAVAAIALPVATSGSGFLMLKRIAKGAATAEHLGVANSVAVVGTTFVSVLLVAFQPLLLPSIPRTTMAAALIGQLITFALSEYANMYAVGLGRLKLAALSRIGSSAVRLLGLAIFVAAGDGTLETWAWYLCGFGTAAMLVSQVSVSWVVGGVPRFRLPRFSEFREGAPFALSTSSESFLAASDKPLLLRFGHESAAGFYAAGYRLATLGLLPVMALIRANDRLVFKAGGDSTTEAVVHARRVTRQSLLLSAVVSVTLFLVAPMAIDLLLKDSYAETATVIQVLSVLPMIKALQFPIGNALTASGQQNARLWITIGATVSNLVLNLIFIPRGEWLAAASTTIGTEVALSCGLWAVALRAVRTERAASGLKS